MQKDNGIDLSALLPRTVIKGQPCLSKEDIKFTIQMNKRMEKVQRETRARFAQSWMRARNLILNRMRG